MYIYIYRVCIHHIVFYRFSILTILYFSIVLRKAQLLYSSFSLMVHCPNDGPGSADSTEAGESRLTSCSVLRALEVLFQFLSFLGKKAMGKIEGVRFTCIGTGLICLNIILNPSCLSWRMLKVVPHQLSICMRLYVF